MKYRRTNKVGKFEVKKIKNKGAVSKNVVRVADLSTLPLNTVQSVADQEKSLRSELEKIRRGHTMLYS